jgi:hypothetical protein
MPSMPCSIGPISEVDDREKGNELATARGDSHYFPASYSAEAAMFETDFVQAQEKARAGRWWAHRLGDSREGYRYADMLQIASPIASWSMHRIHYGGFRGMISLPTQRRVAAVTNALSSPRPARRSGFPTDRTFVFGFP